MKKTFIIISTLILLYFQGITNAQEGMAPNEFLNMINSAGVIAGINKTSFGPCLTHCFVLILEDGSLLLIPLSEENYDCIVNVQTTLSKQFNIQNYDNSIQGEDFFKMFRVSKK